MEHYVSFVVGEELDKEEASTLFKVVNKYAPVASVVAVDDEGKEFDQTVMTMTVTDNNQYEYRIPLTRSLKFETGEKLSRELAERIDLDFEIEASL